MAFTGDSIFWVETEKVVPNPFQPRREFDESKLKELGESIRMYGVLQPLTVTRKEIQREDGAFYTEYELIAGERRLRASKLAGIAQVPVLIRDGEQSEQEKLELAIIENLQREDLNAVDRGLAFRQLADVFGLSHAQVAQKVGRSREYVSNTMRLLQLPEYMLSSLRQADISEGHARTLLMLNDRPEEQDTVYREILLKKLSVREVERIARKIATDKVRKKNWKDTNPELIEIEKKFTETLGTRVQILKTDFGGKLTIDYFSEEDLDKLLKLVQHQDTSGRGTRSASAVISEELNESIDETDEIIESLTSRTALELVPDLPKLPEEVSEKTYTEKPSEISPAPILARTEETYAELEPKSDTEPIPSSMNEVPSINTDNQPGEKLPEVKATPTEFDLMEKAPVLNVPKSDAANNLPPVHPKTEKFVKRAPLITMPQIPTPETISQPSTKTTGEYMNISEIKDKEDDDSGLYTIKNFGI